MNVFRTPEPWLHNLRKPQVLRAKGSSHSITSVNKPPLCEDFVRIVLVGLVGAITEMLREAFSMNRAFAASLVERHYSGLHAPA